MGKLTVPFSVGRTIRLVANELNIDVKCKHEPFD